MVLIQSAKAQIEQYVNRYVKLYVMYVMYVMYVLALSDYKQIFKACCRGLQTRPPIRQINYQTVMRHERKLTWGRRVPEAADKIAVYRVKVFLFEFFQARMGDFNRFL